MVLKKPFLIVLCFLAHQGFSQELLDTLPFESTLYGVDVTTDGSLIFIAGKDTTATVWNSQKELLTTFQDHLQPISSIHYLEQESTVITGSYDNTAMLWDLEGELILTLQGHTNGVIKVTQSTEFLATASRDGTAKIWNRKGQLLFTLNHEAQVNDVRIIEERQWIVTGSFDQTMKIWNYDGALMRTITGHPSGIRSVSISLSENLLLAGHRDGTLSILSLDGTLQKTVAAHGRNGEEYKMINTIAMAQNPTRIITAGADGYVRIWDLHGKLQEETLVAPDKDAYVSGIALTEANLFTASGGKNPSLKIWKL